MGAVTTPFDLALEGAARETDGFDCNREGRGHRLRLWGHLPPAWAGHLAMNVYTRGLTIVSGEALRMRSGRWAAQLLLDATEPVERLSYDFLTMARRGPRLVPELPSPVVSISATPAQGAPGSAFARVRGKDSVGLLAEVLRRFAAIGLQPRRFVLRTEGQAVDDSFWLVPSASTGIRSDGSDAVLPNDDGAAPP